MNSKIGDSYIIVYAHKLYCYDWKLSVFDTITCRAVQQWLPSMSYYLFYFWYSSIGHIYHRSLRSHTNVSNQLNQPYVHPLVAKLAPPTIDLVDFRCVQPLNAQNSLTMVSKSVLTMTWLLTKSPDVVFDRKIVRTNHRHRLRRANQFPVQPSVSDHRCHTIVRHLVVILATHMMVFTTVRLVSKGRSRSRFVPMRTWSSMLVPDVVSIRVNALDFRP